MLPSNLQGKHMTCLIKALENYDPPESRGCEAMFKLLREFRGNTGPRLMKLVKDISAPRDSSRRKYRVGYPSGKDQFKNLNCPEASDWDPH